MMPLLLAMLQTVREPSLFDKPEFVEGKFEAAVDAGAHASAGPAARDTLPPFAILNLPAAGPTGSAEHDRALALEAAGQPVEAARLFASAVRADPSAVHVLDAAVHLMAHGATAAAAQMLAEGVRLYPKNADLRLAMGAAQFGLGRYDSARREFLAAGDTRAFEGLALVAQADAALAPSLIEPLAASPYHQSFADRGRAEMLLRKAIEQDPGHRRARFELARVYLDLGKDSAAERELKELLRLDAGHELAHYRLALLYRRTGRKAEAEPHFAAYRKLHAKRLESEEAVRKARILLTEVPVNRPK